MGGSVKTAGAGDPACDARAAAALSARDETAMDSMAADWRTAPEILFVLSQAPNVATRVLVAANRATPEVADDLLLHDGAAAVRAELGRKIAAALPEFDGPDAARLRDAAAAKLLVLARDAEVTVRRALAQAVAHLDCIPGELVTTLVRDVDALVAVPIAQFSPMLDDDDLIALIAEAPSALTLSAIARREGVSGHLADRLIDLGIPTVMGALLRNPTAHLRESALDRLVDHAVAIEELQAPLVDRPELTERLVVRLSEFVAGRLLSALAERHRLSREVREMIAERIREHSARTDFHGDGRMPSEDDVVGAIGHHSDSQVVAALARRAGISIHAVKRVFAMRMAKAIVALSWKAGLSMEAALALQAFPGRIPQQRRVVAGAGGGYPIDENELEWQLSALGIGSAEEA